MSELSNAKESIDVSDQIDLIRGVKGISRVLGMTERQTYHLLENGHLRGAFKLGRAWCARPSTLLAEIRRLEGREA